MFIVILSKDKKGFVFVKHKDRTTWEIPGGHIEPGETPLEAAKRELSEETGALDFKIEAICTYSVENNEIITYGGLFYAEILSYSPKLDFEIEKIESFKNIPENLTYPQIQPHLFQEIVKRLEILL